MEGRNLQVTAFPVISLVQRVVPKQAKKTVGLVVPWETEEISSSRFGAPNEVADLGCIIEGILLSHPDAEIVATEIFWNQVADLEEKVNLSELFDTPRLERWQEAQIDVLVAAYHQKLDVEMYAAELFIEGGYNDTDRETAAMLVVDLHSEAIIQATEAIFEDVDIVGHVLVVVPLALVTIAASDPCEVVGQHAGEAIAKSVPKATPRIVVVASEDNPFRALEAASEIAAQLEESEQQRVKHDPFRQTVIADECPLPISDLSQFDLTSKDEKDSSCEHLTGLMRAEEICLSADAQMELFERCASWTPDPTTVSLSCDLAMKSYTHAQARLAYFFRNGLGSFGYDPVRAYKLYDLAGYQVSRDEVASQLTASQLVEARRLVTAGPVNLPECEAESVQFGTDNLTP